MNKIRKRRDNLIYVIKDETPSFKYTIQTQSNNYAYSLSMSALPETMVIDWGDGSTEQFTNVSSVSHSYTTAGPYQITLKHSQGLNKCPKLNFQNSTILKTVDTPFLTMYSGSGLEITEVNNMFDNCSRLTTIPQGLFDNNTAVTNFNSCFSYCSSLTTIPAGLFDNNTAVTNFGGCFYGCSRLTTIPQGLFDNNTAVTNFNSCFNGCSSLTTIPAGLFDNNTAVTGFNSCFLRCSRLTTIPAGLFDNNTAVTNFNSCFNGCSSLTTIPAGLFDNNTAVTKFSNCFYGCSMLKLNSNIFCDEETEKATRFSTVNNQIDFKNCFNTSQFTGEKGTAPALWEYTYSTTPQSTNCFNSNTIDSQITNALDVPAEWKS